MKIPQDVAEALNIPLSSVAWHKSYMKRRGYNLLKLSQSGS